ncbi:MAG: type II toxin-antitoxin system VapC family toxin [Actinomycetota bacterium]|nr:type II toxin-antitoxin system VapC family toxin [Actinomycetota bacterium]
MIVVDASAIVELLLRTEIGEQVEPHILGPGASLNAPDLLDYEVLSALRRRELREQIAPTRALEALEDLREIPITLYPTRPLHPRAWMLRRNLTAADALYAALGETLGAPLLTTDAALARSLAVHTSAEVVDL